MSKNKNKQPPKIAVEGLLTFLSKFGPGAEHWIQDTSFITREITSSSPIYNFHNHIYITIYALVYLVVWLLLRFILSYPNLKSYGSQEMSLHHQVEMKYGIWISSFSGLMYHSHYFILSPSCNSKM